MKRVKRSVAVLCAAGLLLSSCKKDDDTVAADTNEQTSTVVLGPYQPSTAGSWWTYEGDMEYTLAVAGRDTVLSGETYAVFSNSNTGGVYFQYENGNYYVVNGVLPFLAEEKLLYLKDNADIGDSWEQLTLNGGSINEVNYVFTLTDKHEQLVLGNEVFDNVIEMTLERKVEVSGIEDITISTFVYYHAEGIGFIGMEEDMQVELASRVVN